MRHGSLFSGIGGFDLASEWMGWENVFHCEWMDFPRKVLHYYWPDADSHIDICKTDFKKYANRIDILTGGFPCQPFSQAGKRKGKDDERYLWGEMLRAIQEIKPKYVIAENVFGITNIDGGLVFEQVCLDLETEGYEVQPFIIPAAAKNAPHRRDRVWFVAYSNCNDGRSTNRKSRCKESKSNTKGEQSVYSRTWSTSNEGNATNTNSGRLERSIEGGRNSKYGTADITVEQERQYSKKNFIDRTKCWEKFPTESPVCGRNDGFPSKLDGITFSKWRAESIKGYGNAIVPQVAFELFKQLEKLNNNFEL
jgi:DNA (cytosine-5)-methyltransferase 1